MARLRPARLRQADLEMTPLAEAQRLLKAGRLKEAAGLCQQIVEQNPEATDAWRLLATIYIAQSRHDDAMQCYRRVLDQAPDSSEAHNNLGALIQIEGDSSRAAEHFRRAIELRPEYAQAHCNLGVALRRLGRLDEAIASQRRAIAIAPDYAKAHYNLGNVLKDACEPDAAIAAFQGALALDPDHAEAHNNLGTVFEARGQTAEALGEFSRAMALDETYAEAHYNHALLHRFTADDPAFEQLRALPRRAGHTEAMLNRLGFALAKAEGDLGHYARAFALYDEANAQRRRRVRYDREAAEDQIAAIIAEHNERRDGAADDAGAEGPVAIFVTGLSRSGKSLAEALLAAQPGVYAAGESDHWRRRGDGAAYRVEMKRLAGSASFAVNTLDDNILSLGEIAAALPEARFIHCHRAPFDNALAIYFKRYERTNAHAYGFDDIAHFMALREKLRAHWQRLYPERVLSIGYEEMVRDTAGAAARLAAHAGTEFDPGATLPEPHDDEIGVWKCYEAHIGPLRAAFADQGIKI